MKILHVYQNILGSWMAGTSSYNIVEAETCDEAIKLWKQNNKGIKVKIEIS